MASRSRQMAACRAALALAAAAATLAGPAFARETVEGPWWVVLGSSPAPGSTGLEFPAAMKAAEAARRCGVTPFNDFSAKFEGFAPDLMVAVAAGATTRKEAEATLAKVRPCVPGAYLKRGLYAGE